MNAAINRALESAINAAGNGRLYLLGGREATDNLDSVAGFYSMATFNGGRWIPSPLSAAGTEWQDGPRAGTAGVPNDAMAELLGCNACESFTLDSPIADQMAARRNA